MANIELKEHTTDLVIRDTYQLEVDGVPYTVKEISNAKHRVIDTEIHDATGNPLPEGGDSPAIYDAIMEFLNELEEESATNFYDCCLSTNAHRSPR
jgi:hypothetical protein